jgi:hypothetical protein
MFASCITVAPGRGNRDARTPALSHGQREGRKARRRVGVVATNVAVAMCLGVGTASAQIVGITPSPPLLLPPSARAVALSFWPKWQSAQVNQVNSDAAAIRRLSIPGPVQDAVLMNCTYKSYLLHQPCAGDHLLRRRLGRRRLTEQPQRSPGLLGTALARLGRSEVHGQVKF